MDVLIIAFGVIVAILWLIIGWRGMKAHEMLARQAERANDSLESPEVGSLNDDMRIQSRLYNEFVRSHPGVESLTSKERHDSYREWSSKQGD